MVERFLEYKNFCTDVENNYPFLKISSELWEFAKEFTDTFRSLKLATVRLQSEQLVIGDFYAIWLELKLELEQKQCLSNMERILLKSMNKREKLLLEGNHVVSALFLHPRFSILLTDEQNIIAREHVYKIGKRLISLRGPRETGKAVQMQSESEENNQSVKSILDKFLLQKEKEKQAKSNNLINCLSSNETKNLQIEINEFNPRREKTSINCLNFWLERKNVYKELSKAAEVILAVPATQVSVERNFSVLKLILNEKRTNIKDVQLENILMCKLNM